MGDRYFGSVRYLLNFDDNSIADVKGNSTSIAGAGNGPSTVQKKFGTHSCVFVRASGRGLSIPDTAALKPGSSDFTWEAWIYPTTITGQYTILRKAATGNGPLVIYITSGQKLSALFTNASNATTNIADPANITVNAWTHVAVVRSGTTVTLYKNASAVASGTVTGSLLDNSFAWNIGSEFSTSASSTFAYDGYIDDIRYTMTARSVEDFNFLAAASISNIIYQLSVQIAESSPLDSWIVRVYKIDTGEFIMEKVVSTTTINTDTLFLPNSYVSGPVMVMAAPNVRGPWTASAPRAVNDMVFASSPEVSDGIFRVVAQTGPSGAIEPVWPATNGANVTDGGVTWQRVASLLQPVVLSPRVPDQVLV